MKVVKVLNQEATTLVYDPLNQAILTKLVASEGAVSDLAGELNQPTLKVWRRMQKLIKANLVELVRTKKVGNTEKKLYRSSATWFVPYQYFNLKPKDANLQRAFEVYSDIQKDMMATLLASGDVPQEAEPTDFSLFMHMQAFVEACEKPATQKKISDLEEALVQFRQQCKYLERPMS
jgi:predicted ArsR family transcriptional regulator